MSIQNFTAQPRTPEPWTYLDVAKIALFPITGVCLAVQYICSLISYLCGVVGTDSRSQSGLLGEHDSQLLRINTQDGATLQAQHFVNPNAAENAKTVIICSGSHSTYQSYTPPMVDGLIKQGYHVVVFNYRGFGQSSGSPSQLGFNLDAEAVYQYLKSQEIDDEKIAVLGYSMGTGPATDLAAHHRIDLILDRYFSSMSDVAYDHGGFIAKMIFKLGDADFDIRTKIRSVEGRIFLANGMYDSTMRRYHRDYLESSLEGRAATFVEFQGGHHHFGTDLWFHPESSNDEAREKLLEFLNG